MKEPHRGRGKRAWIVGALLTLAVAGCGDDAANGSDADAETRDEGGGETADDGGGEVGRCGDGTCGPGENCGLCPANCGACPPGT
jgi:hypothetical protein